MSGSRDQILAGIRRSLGREPGAQPPAEGARRLDAPASNVIPARGRINRASRIKLFITEAERVNATTKRLKRREDIPSAVAGYLRSTNLPTRIRVATGPPLDGLAWSDEAMLRVSTGAAAADDGVSVTGAFGGVAETGTLVMLSGREHPVTLNFLPDTHIAVLSSDRIVGTYEQIWARLRATLGQDQMPRVVNWITGPSRTADIEQTLLLGAHGPRRLHILIVDG